MQSTTKSALIWIALGVLFVLISLVIEFASLTPTETASHAFSFVGYKFFEIIGIAVFAVGCINLSIEARDWSEYFGRRIREIVVEQSYLNTLDKDRLTAIQIAVLKAQFKDQNIDREGSFLNYLNTYLHPFIAAPYREDVSAEVICTDDGQGCWDVLDKLSFVCRASGTEFIDTVHWGIEEEGYVSVEGFKVEVRLPQKLSVTIYDEKPPMGQSLTLSLKDYREDRLLVTMTERAKIRKDRFQFWTMAHPTKNFRIAFSFPDDHEIQIIPFVLSPELISSTKSVGYYSTKYDFWMLPESGLSWMLVPKTTLAGSRS
jgi:hypothetical protein